MRSLQLSFAPKQIFRSDFAAEWLGVAVLVVIAAIWARTIKFDLAVQWHDALGLSGVILLVMIAHVIKSERASLAAEYFLLTAIATATIGVVSYLSMATDRPLADGVFMAADRAIGFDWLTDYRWVLHHGLVAKILQFAYGTLVSQGLFFGVFFGLKGRRQDLREMFWLVVVSSLFTCAGAAFFPALGPFKTFGIKAEFLPAMEQLRSGNLHFALANITGVVCFPSFHTTMALLYIYAFRRTGAIGWMFAALNVVMLLAIPFFGGHYVVDMLAGGAVALASFAIVKVWPAFAFPAMPGRACAPTGFYEGLFEGGASRLSHQRSVVIAAEPATD